MGVGGSKMGGCDNPYDYMHPITADEMNRAARRPRIEKELRRCLVGAAAGGFMNLALVGPRGTGKTTLLTQAEELALRLGLITCRLDLDEGLGKNEGAFLAALAQQLLATACRWGMVGFDDSERRPGFRQTQPPAGGATSEALHRVLAEAIVAGRATGAAATSESIHGILKATEAAAVGRGFAGLVVLLDEADVLVLNRSTLQRIRNALQRLRRTLLMVAGTQLLFREASEVFSPITRLFRRVQVAGFDSLAETQECIQAPLQGISRAGCAPDLFTTEEVHRFCGGNPYEILLVSHFMFRRMVDSGEARMRLDVNVIEQVLSCTEPMTEAGEPSFESRLRALGRDDLRLAMEHIPHEALTLAQQAIARTPLAALEVATLLDAEERVCADWEKLRALGVVDFPDEGSRFSFVGGDQHRVYLKYLAAAGGALPAIGEFQPETGFRQVVTAKVSRSLVERVRSSPKWEASPLVFQLSQQPPALPFRRAARQLASAIESDEPSTVRELGTEAPLLAEYVEAIHRASKGRACCVVLLLDLPFEAGTVRTLLYQGLVRRAPRATPPRINVQEWLAAHRDQLWLCGVGEAVGECHFLDSRAMARLAKATRAYSELDRHHADMLQHFRGGKLAASGRAAGKALSLAMRLGVARDIARLANCAGFILMARGNLEAAEESFLLSITKDNTALARANRGYLLGRRGKWAQAARVYRKALEVLEHTGEPNPIWLYVVVARPCRGQVAEDLVDKPDLRAAIRTSLASLHELKGDRRKATAAFRAIRRDYPSVPFVHAARGWWHVGRNRLTEAAECFDQALAIDPGLPMATGGAECVKQGEPEGGDDEGVIDAEFKSSDDESSKES